MTEPTTSQPAAPKWQPGQPLWRKLALFTGVFVLAATLTLGYALTAIAERTVTVMSRDYRLAIAEDIAQNIETSLQTGRADLQTVARVLGTRGDIESSLAWSQGIIGSSSSLDHVVVFDASGKRIDALVEEGAPTPPTADLQAELVAELTERPNAAFGAVTFVDDQPRVQVSAPIVDDAGRVTGFVSAAAILADLSARVQELAQSRLATRGSRLLVVDEQRRLVASSVENSAADQSDHPMLGQPQVLLTQGVAQSGEAIVTGREVVASVLPLPDLSWFVTVEIRRDVAYESLDEMRRGIWLSVFGIFVLIVVASIAGAQRITGPLARLTSFASRIAQREFDARVPIESNDEVGLLATVMNDAAQQLADSEETIRRETAIRADLGRFLPAQLVDAVVQREQNMELGGVRTEITVMFADIVRFTPLCETLAPEDTVKLLNEFFTIATEIIFRHDGTVDKFVGDSVMAFWGAPEAVPDHADRALRAADDLVRWLEVGNEEWRRTLQTEIEIAVGIGTGTAVVGNVGSDTRMEYTIIGETVNTAARLEALARPGQVLTTRATRDASREFDFAMVTTTTIHEADEPIEVWEMLS